MNGMSIFCVIQQNAVLLFGIFANEMTIKLVNVKPFFQFFSTGERKVLLANITCTNQDVFQADLPEKLQVLILYVPSLSKYGFAKLIIRLNF